MQIRRAWQIAQIAKLYYIDNLTQEMIAEQLQVSRSTISRALLDAKNHGIVEIRIKYPYQQVKKLESALCEKFDLKAALVLKTQKDWSYEDILDGLGTLAAQYFMKVIQPNSLVVISSGKSIYHTINALEEHKLDLQIVQVIGVPISHDPVMDGPELGQLLAKRMGGSAMYLQAPFVVKNAQTYRKLMEENPFEEIVKLINHADVALFGVGTIDPESSSLTRTGFSIESLNELMRCGAVGEISGQTFDRFGRLVFAENAQKAVSIELEHLKKIPCAIGISGGIAKTQAIRGALTGQLLNVIVTDEDVAQALLKSN
jgi:DNA-binding transcriptional regulator LsrR (DeoR family)